MSEIGIAQILGFDLRKRHDSFDFVFPDQPCPYSPKPFALKMSETVTGLASNSSFTFTVRARDIAGNVLAASKLSQGCDTDRRWDSQAPEGKVEAPWGKIVELS